MKPEKCEFHKEDVRYFRLLTGRGIVKIDTDKVAVTQDWPVPQSTFDLRLFIGFANIYRSFIRNLSEILGLLTVLTRKDVKFRWSEECQRVFEVLREAFVTGRVLAHLDWTKEVVFETPTSD